MKRAFLRFGLGLVFSLLLLAQTAAPVAAAPAVPAVHAEAAALIDVKSGRLLYERQANKKMKIASLTKIMTAVVAIENGNLSDLVETGKNAYGREGSSIYLRLHEKMSLHHLLYGLMLRSGNDAAEAIALHVGGSVEGFVHMMNLKADELGLENTHFANPHGLDAENHYSTARDLAVLTAYALKNPVFQEIVKTDVKKIQRENEPGTTVWFNKNKMLAIYPGADGVKTGYTRAAGRCLVSSATRGGQQLAVVTLNDRMDWADHSKLLDYGFANFPLVPLIEKDETVGEGIRAARTVWYPLTAEERRQIAQKPVINPPESVAYRLGDAGKLVFTLADRPIASVPLYAEGGPRLSWEQPAFAGRPEGNRFGSFGEALKRIVETLVTLRG